MKNNQSKIVTSILAQDTEYEVSFARFLNPYLEDSIKINGFGGSSTVQIVEDAA